MFTAATPQRAPAPCLQGMRHQRSGSCISLGWETWDHQPPTLIHAVMLGTLTEVGRDKRRLLQWGSTQIRYFKFRVGLKT